MAPFSFDPNTSLIRELQDFWIGATHALEVKSVMSSGWRRSLQGMQDQLTDWVDTNRVRFITNPGLSDNMQQPLMLDLTYAIRVPHGSTMPSSAADSLRTNRVDEIADALEAHLGRLAAYPDYDHFQHLIPNLHFEVMEADPTDLF